MVDLEGLVLVSDSFGYGKITSHVDGRVCIRFMGQNRDAWYGVKDVAAQKDFKWRPMPIGLKCRVPERGTCTISEATFEPSESARVHEYLVVFDGDAGQTARLTERELWPIPGSLAESPLTKLTGLQGCPVARFRAREALLSAFRQVDRESAGIRALAASRISILPHQAFVVGTVVDDPVWRYVLADEVGLGKTIEAGVIAHQLLAAKSDARILILCPGPLSRQWLCEMHMSFSGRDFRLLDLHDPNRVSLGDWRLVISSLKTAAREHEAALQKVKWDLVIVDEAHQLLWNDVHYALVDRLARATPRLLLLSAVPARERESELLRLLRLIDPVRYADGGPTARRFALLYAAQAALGRRVRIVARQLDRPNELDREQLQEDVEKLLLVDVLRDDVDLKVMQRAATESVDVDGVVPHYRQLVEEVVSRYRISRRILKNRRARLVDASLIAAVARQVVLESYEPSPLEEQISALALDLLEPLAVGRNLGAFQVLFRKMAQALCDPVALYDIANALAAGGDGLAPASKIFDANAALDYDEHDALLEACGAAFTGEVDEPMLQRWLSLLRAAIDVQESSRIVALKSCLKRLQEEGLSKVLVFAGPFGTAEFVADALATEFGSAAVASFRHDLTDDDKEAQVIRFRREQKCVFLVSDESGGEGRNFQFADVLVHFDLPWSVSAVEQRIGRLDRIGRDRPVRSHVICPRTGLEPAWFQCLSDGFSAFSRSISGLEFLLHTTEWQTVATTAGSGPNALLDSIPSIREACDRERASDDAEAVTDAASFRSTRYLRSVESTADTLLEEALPPYLRALGNGQVAKRITDSKDLNLRTWRLRPEDVTDYKLPGLDRDGDNPLRDRYGTFSRAVARERADLEFFTVGHPVVDAIAIAAHQHVAGRSFMARIITDALPAGLYLLSCWRPADAQPGRPEPIPERAMRLLNDRSLWTGVDFETGNEVDSSAAQRVVDQIRENEAAATDLTKATALEVFRPEPGQWAITLKQMLDRSEGSVMAQYASKYQLLDAELCSRLTAEAEDAIRTHPDEGSDYAEGLTAAVAAIQAVKLGVDALGLLKVDAPSQT
jgi:ATP-dependent helicase HepA